MNNNLESNSIIKEKYVEQDIRVEAYKDIKVELEIKKLFGMLTEESMQKITENEKIKRNDPKVSYELDNHIPKMIEEVKKEMKNKKNSGQVLKDDFLTKEGLSNYIEEKRKDQSKILTMRNKKEENKAA